MSTGAGVAERVPGTPYIIETFCISDHGITAGYRRGADGRVEAVAETPTNPAVEEWGPAVRPGPPRSRARRGTTAPGSLPCSGPLGARVAALLR
ncbi:hypothetical protein Are01nite_86660 [Actinoplanes regularis]|nr:hypothetical protein Are01nite_86660 [Actinoplanes regularis]